MARDLGDQPAAWFWFVVIGALGWNGLGVVTFISHVTSPAAASGEPVFYSAAFGLAVFAGTLGSLLLLLRKRSAIWAFLASLAGVLVQQAYHFAQSDFGQSLSTADFVLAFAILSIALALIWLARQVSSQGWLD